MNCRYVQSRLCAYIDMELPAEEHYQIRSHLENCLECSLEYERLRRTKALLRQLPVVSPSRSPEILLMRIRAQRSVPSSVGIRFGWRASKGWQVAGGAVAVGIFLWWNMSVSDIRQEASLATAQPDPTSIRSFPNPPFFKARSFQTSPIFVSDPINQPFFSSNPVLPASYGDPLTNMPSYGGFSWDYPNQNR